MQDKKMPMFYTVASIAEKTGLSYNFWRQAILNGEVPYITCGKKRMIEMDDALNYLDKVRVVSKSKKDSTVIDFKKAN